MQGRPHLATTDDDRRPPVPDDVGEPYTGSFGPGGADAVFYCAAYKGCDVAKAVMRYLCNDWSSEHPAVYVSAATIAWELAERADPGLKRPQPGEPGYNRPPGLRMVQITLKRFEAEGLISIRRQKWGGRRKAIPVIWRRWLLPGGSWSRDRYPGRPLPAPAPKLKVHEPPAAGRGRRGRGAADCAQLALPCCTCDDDATVVGATDCAASAQPIAPEGTRPPIADCSNPEFSDFEREQEPLTACASGPDESPPTVEALLAAELAELPESDRERLYTEARKAVPPPLLRGSGGESFITAEMNRRLIAQNPGRYERAERAEAVAAAAAGRAKAERAGAEALAKSFRHDEPRLLLALEAGDDAGIEALAKVLSARFSQRDSRRGFAATIRAALDGRRDRREVAEELDLALNYAKHPETLPWRFRKLGVRGPGAYWIKVVYHDLAGPPLKENASPRVDSTRSGTRRRDSRRSEAVTPNGSGGRAYSQPNSGEF
jgi:hypothetical protein